MSENTKHINHDLLAAYIAGQATDEQIHEVELWLAASVENQKYFDGLFKIWNETGMLDSESVAVDVDAAWNKLNSRMAQAEETGSSQIKTKTFNPARFTMRVAAVLLPLIIAISIYFYLKPGADKTLISMNEPVTQILADSSVISLNKNSKLTYSETFNNDTREISLEGEAFFKVKHNEEQPFIVHTENADIMVLGTSFNVKSYPGENQLEVTVVTGKVKLYGTSGSGQPFELILPAGSKGIYDLKTNEALKEEATDQNELYWNTKTLIFSKTELKKVTDLLNKCYNVNIVIKDKTIENCKLSATFSDMAIDSVIDVIATSFDLNVKKDGKNYELSGNGC